MGAILDFWYWEKYWYNFWSSGWALCVLKHKWRHLNIFSNCKSEELWYTPVFSKIALHDGGHLELKKMHRGDFRGLFGTRLGRCPCIIPEKISFLQFYSYSNLMLLHYWERNLLNWKVQYNRWQTFRLTPVSTSIITLLGYIYTCHYNF